ncbi:hypothetical protein MPSEU_000146400 [Mayamaea pseudoterrestris]|nr:hypothetical protein MPSEU_000146400 [Mayamaea pseudoterrestris]
MATFLGDLATSVPTTLHNLSSAIANPFDKKKWTLTKGSLPPNYVPGDWDVCCGRGKRNWNHMGNVRFRKLVQSHVQRYIQSPTRNDKTQVVICIVDFVREKGGHFLKQDKSNRWYDIGDAEARDKVGHSLRDQVTAIQRQKKNAKTTFTRTQQRAHVERHSSTQSDSGNETELRKSSNITTSLVRATFERRPSFIMDSYGTHGSFQMRMSSMVSGDEAASVRVNNLRRSTNWEFLDSLDDILDLVASDGHNTSSKFIENLDQVDHQLYMDDTPLRLSETVGTISEFTVGESVDGSKKVDATEHIRSSTQV